ncbi:La-related protein like [Actinidia chinensis var. chinensis]|uniref:La-related protein like n=1 Tax=Actinidia chinensis var. chinensis TaxID=1590841 RepID=A0A2R6RJ08_ACTCC|nr:La-related protein like [Actinidia chinensis var. chinensis]
MAAAANHSGEASAVNSPQSKRAVAARGAASPPWKQVVRGAESDSLDNSSPDRSPSKAATAASSSSSLDHSVTENSDYGSGSSNAAKKLVWNKPSNGVELGPVMGGVSWPALSESTRASPKSTSSDSLKPLSDGSVSISLGTGIVSSSTPKQVFTNNTNPNLTPNHVAPTRQKSMKRGGGSSSGNATANGGFTQPPLPLGTVVETPSNNAGKSDLHVPESGQRGGFGQSHGGNDHPQQRNSFRRGNGGPYPRGDGSYHHNLGGKRDQDREWNSHRGFSGRDAHMHPQRGVPRGVIRPPPHNSIPFIPSPPPVPLRTFGNPIGYPEVPPPMMYLPAPTPDSYRGVPVVAQMPHAMFFNVPDLPLHVKVVNQIDYYFSNANLIKDTFLRQNMDDQGWVSINLIASFKKVSVLTDNIPFILDALGMSSVVEVKENKIRKRDDWWRWVMPPSTQFPTVSSPQLQGSSSYDMLAANIQGVSLEDEKNKHGQAELFPSRSSAGDLNSQPSSVEWTGQATVQIDSDHSLLARSSSK